MRGLPNATPAQERAAAWVCGQAGRGFDLADPAQRRAAATLARPVLEALDIVEPREALPRRSLVNGIDTAVHGTRSGAEAHRALKQALCGPCLRWVEVEAHKNGTEPAEPPTAGKKPPTIRHNCGSRSGYRMHMAHGEEPCDGCRAANSEACREYGQRRNRAKAGA